MNLTKKAQAYVNERPYLRRSFHQNIINYSALARKIISEENINKKHLDAIIVALRRLQEKARKKSYLNEPQKKILSESSMTISSNILVLVISKHNYLDCIERVQKKVRRKNDVLRIIEGVNSVTLITKEKYAEELKQVLGNKIIKEHHNLIEVILQSTQNLENVPGVISYIYSRLADEGINIVETMSCWTDTILVIRKESLAKTTEILSTL